MDFNTYMESKIPGYKSLVPEEKLAKLKDAFDNKQAYDREAKGYLTYVPSAGIDYSNKFEKAMGNHQRWAMILEGEIEEVREQLGLVSEEENSVGVHK